MSPKLLAVLSILALVLGGLALALVSREPKAAEGEGLGLLFPDLADRLNAAVEVQVRNPEGGYTLRLEEGRWGLVEKGGYPVKVEDVRRTLWALTTLERRQAMTDDPARYGRLGVEDTEREGASGKRLVLRDGGGGELAALIVGEARGDGRGLSSFYARIPSERRSWLVEGELPLPADADAWLDRQPVKLERREVRAVETRHPDGEVVRISRPSREQDTFDVEAVPEDRELRFATVASGMGSALEYLSFVDVAPAAGFEPGEGEPVVTSLWTFDGLRVDASVWTLGEDEHWASFEVAYEPPTPPAADAAGPPLPGSEEGEAAQGDPALVEALEKRVAGMRARVSGWVYKIAPYNHGNLAKRMADLTQPLAPPGALAAPEWDVDLDLAPPAEPLPRDHDHDHDQVDEQDPERGSRPEPGDPDPVPPAGGDGDSGGDEGGADREGLRR